MSISAKFDAPRGAMGKRKERDTPEPPLQAEPGRAAAHAARLGKPAPGSGDNKLLAGYLAHEFLTHGTLLGKRLEPSRRVPAPAPAPARAEPEPARRYAEVSCLLMTDGAHIAGVVNPTELGSWLQIKQ